MIKDIPFVFFKIFLKLFQSFEVCVQSKIASLSVATNSPVVTGTPAIFDVTVVDGTNVTYDVSYFSLMHPENKDIAGLG